MSSSGKSLVGHLLTLDLVGTSTPPKFIVSHISFTPALDHLASLHLSVCTPIPQDSCTEVGFFHNPVADLLFICQSICFTFTCDKH